MILLQQLNVSFYSQVNYGAYLSSGNMNVPGMFQINTFDDRFEVTVLYPHLKIVYEHNNRIMLTYDNSGRRYYNGMDGLCGNHDGDHTDEVDEFRENRHLYRMGFLS